MSRRISNEDMEAATHDYIGTMPCGCVLGVVVDIPKTGASATREAVADFMRCGMTITRIHHDEFKGVGFGRKPECQIHGVNRAKPQTAQRGLFA